MNARKGMQMKIEVLKALGASREMINIYCPEIPPEREDERTNLDWPFADFITKVLATVEDGAYMKTVHIGYTETLLVSDAELIFCFCEHATDCPYCSANLDISGDCVPAKTKCHKCSYGKMYGKCETKNIGGVHSGWGNTIEYMELHGNSRIIRHMNKEKVIADIKDIASRYNDQ